MTSITPKPTPSDEQEFLKFLEQHDDVLLSGKTTLKLSDAALSSFDSDQVELRQLLNLLSSVKAQDESHSNIETDDQFETETTNRDLQDADDSYVFGRFIIRERIGSGGHGIVFRAYDPQIQREVALKIPKLNSVSTPKLRERFLNEARIAGALDHPNVVKILEANEINSVLYIVYPFFNGPNLAQWLKEEYATDQIAEEQIVVDIFRQIVDGTAFAHEHGIIHRDLKPSNILLTSGLSPVASNEIGEPLSNALVPCICDFGIAKDFHEDAKLTATGTMVGTPEYMSPEQICGFKTDIGPASDVYSLGVVLFEMLTGTTPLHGETNTEIYRRIIEEPPRLIRSLRPDVSAVLEAIYLKCLEKKIQHRYQSASDLAAELGRFAEGKRVRAYGARSLRKKSRDFFQRKTSFSTVIGVAGCTVLLSLGLFWISQSKVANRVERVVSNNGAANVSSIPPTFSPSELRKRHTTYIADMKRGYEMWNGRIGLGANDGSGDAITQLLSHYLPRPGIPDLRRFEWHYLNRLVNPQKCAANLVPLNDLKGHERDVFSIDFSKDGKFLATAGFDQTARLWDAQTSELIRVFRGHVNDVNVVRFSSDGKLLATGSDDESIRLWQVEDGKLIGELKSNDGWIYELDFSKSGKLIASGAHDGTVRIWDVGTQKNIATFEDHDRRVMGLEWSQDGSRLATAGTEGKVIIRKLPSFEIEHEIDISQKYLLHRPSSLAFSPDFHLLAIGTYKDARFSGEGPIFVVDVRSGQIVTELKGHQQRVRSVKFIPGESSDQYTLISTSDEGCTLMWDIETGNNWEPFANFDVRCWELAVSADGHRIAAAGSDQKVHLWKTNDESSIRVDQRWTLLPGGTTSTFSFSRDGHFIAEGFINNDTGGIRFWDLGENRSRLIHQKSGRRPTSIDFSPDGQLLAVVEKLQNDGVPVVTFLDAQTLEEQSQLKQLQISGQADFISYSPDGTKLFTISGAGSDTHQINVWDMTTGTLLKMLPCDPEFVASLKVTPDGEAFAVTRKRDSTRDRVQVEIYDLLTLSPAKVIDVYEADVGIFSFRPENQVVAVSSREGKVDVVDLRTEEKLAAFRFDLHGVDSLVYSPEGSQLVIRHGRHITLISVPEDEIICSLPIPVDTAYLRNTAFSPDGKILAAVRGDKDGKEQVILWDSRLPGF